ncbi:MAG: NADH-quinone oxidoreductase subunit C [Candidatus Thermoplasmatota archaeon]|nr:NADH-quinone oxidoreductase subunit C [Candidatus Thermoplasmatota archaeon]
MEERGKRSSAEGMESAVGGADDVSEEKVFRALLDSFPATVTDFKKLRAGVLRARIDRRDLHGACVFLRDSLGFEHISMISAVEYEGRFEVVYHVASWKHRLLLELITTTPKDDPSVDSVSSVWGGANWQEREAYDLMGIRFNNHPKLERILLPKDYLYHPLRKDFKGGD